MGLLQKRAYSTSEPLYTVGTDKVVLIVGLGNPGKEYIGTRHNIGFAVLDNFAAKLDFPKWTDKKTLKSQQTMRNIGDNRVILIKPTTFMNLSGQAVQAVSNFYKVPASQIVAVYDELDIPFGQIRTRTGGGSAGHNGVKSLIEHMGEDFGRVRIGSQNEVSSKSDSTDFVLDKFSKPEQKELPNLLQEANSILSEYVHSGSLPDETRNFVI